MARSSPTQLSKYGELRHHYVHLSLPSVYTGVMLCLVINQC